MARSKVEGVLFPVHKTAVKCPVEFTVILFDQDGELCRGDHLISAHVKCACQIVETVTINKQGRKGVYTFSYTPKLPVEYTVDVYVNDLLLNQTPIKLFVINTPYVPNCTLSGEGLTTAVKNKVASFQVFLADNEGSPVNSEQTITAHLSSPLQEAECLVIPVQVTMCDLPSVYSVSYMPSVPCSCELTVLVNDEPIGKPLIIAVGKSALSPLAGAALHGQLEFVKLLLQKGEKLTNVS